MRRHPCPEYIQIGSFLIAGEGSAAAGVRRIEALTGMGAESYAQQRLEILDHVARSLNVPAEEVEARVEDLKDQINRA